MSIPSNFMPDNQNQCLLAINTNAYYNSHSLFRSCQKINEDMRDAGIPKRIMYVNAMVGGFLLPVNCVNNT